jgi:hypothetical protein
VQAIEAPAMKYGRSNPSKNHVWQNRRTRTKITSRSTTVRSRDTRRLEAEFGMFPIRTRIQVDCKKRVFEPKMAGGRLKIRPMSGQKRRLWCENGAKNATAQSANRAKTKRAHSDTPIY